MNIGKIERVGKSGTQTIYDSDAQPKAEAPTEWPNPSPLGDDLPPVDSFALELLPQSLRPLVEDISDRMQTPPDFAAIAGIVATCRLRESPCIDSPEGRGRLDGDAESMGRDYRRPWLYEKPDSSRNDCAFGAHRGNVAN